MYNLKEDPTETTNVAEGHPEILQKAAEIFERERIAPEMDIFKIPSISNGLLPD